MDKGFSCFPEISCTYMENLLPNLEYENELLLFCSSNCVYIFCYSKQVL